MSEEEKELIESNLVFEDTLLEITPELMKKTIVKFGKEKEELQDRIDKAIEYITSRSIKAGVELMPREKELLKILKGE